jgi:hypothetical protein
MYIVKCGEDTFVLDSWDEVTEIWREIVMADGAEDAEMTVRFFPETE